MQWGSASLRRVGCVRQLRIASWNSRRVACSSDRGELLRLLSCVNCGPYVTRECRHTAESMRMGSRPSLSSRIRLVADFRRYCIAAFEGAKANDVRRCLQVLARGVRDCAFGGHASDAIMLVLAVTSNIRSATNRGAVAWSRAPPWQPSELGSHFRSQFHRALPRSSPTGPCELAEPSSRCQQVGVPGRSTRPLRRVAPKRRRECCCARRFGDAAR